MGVRVLASCAVSRSKQMPPSCHWQVPAAGHYQTFEVGPETGRWKTESTAKKSYEPRGSIE